MSPKVTEEYKEKRRLELLEVAKKVFIEKGYEFTTMKDIVEQSGFSRGGVYLYFSSTEEMFRSIVELNDIEGRKHIEEIINSHLPIWQYLSELINAYRSIKRSNFATVQFEYAVTGWRAPERVQYIRNRLYYWRKQLVSILEEGVRRGEFTPLQPLESIVDFMIITQDGFLLWSNILRDEDQHEIEGQVDSLLFYLKNVLQVK